MMDAATGGEGVHDFEAADNLFDRSPVRNVREFFDAETRHGIARPIEDYELNAAMKNGDRMTVTALGSLALTGGAELPFLPTIAPKN